MLFAVWFTGLVAYAVDGLMISYLSNSNVYLMLFGTSFIILFGSYMVPRSLDDIVHKVRPMLKLDDLQHQHLSERLERYNASFFPCFFLAVGFFVVSGSSNDFTYTGRRF
jgi:hypothetical protein